MWKRAEAGGLLGSLAEFYDRFELVGRKVDEGIDEDVLAEVFDVLALSGTDFHDGSHDFLVGALVLGLEFVELHDERAVYGVDAVDFLAELAVDDDFFVLADGFVAGIGFGICHGRGWRLGKKKSYPHRIRG